MTIQQLRLLQTKFVNNKFEILFSKGGKKTMKLRKGFIVGMASLLGVTALVGCKKKGEDVKLTKVSINGVQRTYDEGAVIDWSALSVTATYSDATSQTFTKFEFDVTSVVSAETQAVIYTSGLHEQTETTEGVYAISVALPSDLSTKYSAGNIAIGNATPDGYALVECSDPTLKTGYIANIRDAGTDIEPERNDKATAKANENKFISSNTQYVVGTLNPFIYEPEVAFENLNDPTADLITGDDIHFRKTHTVKVKSGNNYIDAPSVDYTVVDGHVKFNESAIGKTFSLTVSLTDFDVVDGTSKKAESTFEGFTVQKGLNIYSARQLGILNVTKLTTAELTEAHYNEHKDDTDKMFWNGTDYYKPVLNELWASYLTSTGTFTASELQAYADTPAIFLQRKIEIKSTDIPSEYFVKAGELAGDTIVGCLRDSVPIYAPIVGSTDVEINGNFWGLDTTAIKLCKNERSDNGPKAYSEGAEDQVIMPGHSALIKFCGIESGDEEFFNNQELVSTGKGIIRNINSIGNTGIDLVSKDFEKMLSLTGLIFAKNDYCGAVYENCIIKQYQIGIFTDNMIGQAYGGKDQTDYSFIRDTRMYDCANSGLFNYHCGGVAVSKSVFNRFGAAPVMNAGSVRENRAPNTKFTKDVIFNNEITGEEIYFSALGATEAVGTIRGFNPLFQQIGNKFVYKNEHGEDVMNLVSIGINGDDYLEADSPNYYSNVMLNSGEGNELKASVYSETNPTMQWQLYSNLRQAIYAAEYAKAYKENWEGAQALHAQMYAAEYAKNRNSEETLALYQSEYNNARNSEDTIAAHDAMYATEYDKAIDAAARAYIIENYENFPPVTPETDPADVPADYVAAIKTNDDFVAGFEAQFNPAFEAEFEAGFKAEFDPKFDAAFKAQFDPKFEAGWKAQAGFDFNETSFKEYFDAIFEGQFEEEYQQPPVFQTEIPSEVFWTDLTEFKTATGTKYEATLEGNYVHLIVPVGTTCLSLTFRISKLPTPLA